MKGNLLAFGQALYGTSWINIALHTLTNPPDEKKQFACFVANPD